MSDFENPAGKPDEVVYEAGNTFAPGEIAYDPTGQAVDDAILSASAESATAPGWVITLSKDVPTERFGPEYVDLNTYLDFQAFTATLECGDLE